MGGDGNGFFDKGSLDLLVINKKKGEKKHLHFMLLIKR